MAAEDNETDSRNRCYVIDGCSTASGCLGLDIATLPDVFHCYGGTSDAIILIGAVLSSAGPTITAIRTCISPVLNV